MKVLDYGVDFETYYDESCSVKDLGALAYTKHADFYPYLVSIWGPGLQWVGNPADAPWDKIAGHRWISHNSVFDRMVYDWLRARNKSLPMPSVWEDSAGLAAYLRYPRALDKLIYAAYGVSLNKGVRNRMKGVHYRDLPEAKQSEVLQYAMDDAKWMMRFWVEHRSLWPAEERELSLMTNDLAWQGIPVDAKGIKNGIEKLKELILHTARQLPWVAEGKPVSSPGAIFDACRDAGIPLPDTTEAKSAEFQEWMDKYGDRAPFIKLVQQWRSLNKTMRALESMQHRTNGRGRMSTEMKYFGAHTGRWSGAAGLNIQNLPKGNIGGIDVRSMIKAPAGKKLIIADLSQIEPRVLAYLIQDKESLQLMSSGMSPYEVHARRTMGYSSKESLKDADPKLYALAKARVLALGYGAGFFKFRGMAKMYVGEETFAEIFRTEPSGEDTKEFEAGREWWPDDLKATYDTLPAEEKWELANSSFVVREFRRTNPLIASRDKDEPGLWYRLDQVLGQSVAMKDKTMGIDTPSGYRLVYYDPFRATDGCKARFEIGGGFRYVYGGLLTENLVQCTARYVFAEGVRRLVRNGYEVLFHVHDEVVVLVDEDQPAKDVVDLLCVCPDWIHGLPIAAEAKESEVYQK